MHNPVSWNSVQIATCTHVLVASMSSLTRVAGSASDMLLKQKYIAVLIGWLSIGPQPRQQAEAFAASGLVSRASGGLKGPIQRTTLDACIPSSPLLPRAVETGWRRTSRGIVPVRTSIEENTVETPDGKPSEEKSSALDALIDQFTSPKNGNITATVEEYLDLCDHALLTHLRGRIESEGVQSEVVRTLFPSQPCKVIRK